MSALYRALGRLFPTRTLDSEPQRVVFILPCCIGDVVIATAASKALRRRFPTAHITWAVGTWSRDIVDGLPWIDAILDTGPSALPVRRPADFARFVQSLRAGKFDMAVSLVRSPLMSLAVALAGIRDRVGLDSAGRGFGYTKRVSIDPDAERHEGDIYLSFIESLGADIQGFQADVPSLAEHLDVAQLALNGLGITQPFIVMNPAGGSNPGAEFHAKRYPPKSFAVLAHGLSQTLGCAVIFVAGKQDAAIVDAVQAHLPAPFPTLVGTLSLREIGALAALSRGYIGNDTGLTHLAAASGAPTLMIMGPSSPTRYAPFNSNSRALWKPVELPSGGVAQSEALAWDWARDGITPEDALQQSVAFLQA